MTDDLATVDVTGAVTSDTGSFANVPHWLLDRLVALGRTNALALYVALTKWENRTTHEAWPSHATLSETLNVGASTVKRWIADLVAVNALRVEARVTERGDPDSNRYVIVRAETVDRPPVTDGPTGSTNRGGRGGVANGLRTRTSLELEEVEPEDSPRPPSSERGSSELAKRSLAREMATRYCAWYREQHGYDTPTAKGRLGVESAFLKCLRLGMCPTDIKQAAASWDGAITSSGLVVTLTRMKAKDSGERWAMPQ